MAKKSANTTSSPGQPQPGRLPERAGDLQVNACKNPACRGFGIAALSVVDLGRAKKDGSSRRDSYRVIGQDGNTADRVLYCKLCGKTSPIKSNQAIQDETARLAHYLEPPVEPACPTAGCSNGSVGIYSHPEAYVCKQNRKTSRRLQCKACRATFSVKEHPLAGQQKPHENKTVFREITTKKPIRGIAKVADLSPAAVYGKIDFIHRQCMGFVGERERRAHSIRRKYARLCVDRQDYMINWKSRHGRKNVQFTSICTVEGQSGYVLGHHLNFDPDRNQVEIDDIARSHGDMLPGATSYFRAQAQYWHSEEFHDFARKNKDDIRPDVYEEPLNIDRLIEEKTREIQRWPKREMADYPGRMNQLPPDGVMTHFDYTAYAHARLIRRLVGQTKYITIYTDQDEVLRAAYMAAFAGKIAMDEVEMAYVQFQKMMDIDQKRELSNACKPVLAGLAAQCGCGQELAISRHMAWEYARSCQRFRDWRKRWIVHPRDTMNEPLRRIQYLTDTGRKNLEQIGWVLSGATLAPVDNYFMRIRRKIYYAERPIPSHTNANRLYYGYHAYDPKRVLQLIEIFRVFTNYIWTREDGTTPAMRFGLAKGPLRYEDILYWRPFR